LRRRLATPLVTLAALSAAACATAGAVTSTVRDSPNKLNGVYKTRVDSEFQSGALNGVWRLRLDNDAYTFNYTGKSSRNVIISGVYVVSGRRITFRDRSAACSAKPDSGGCRFLGCRKPSTYTFTLTTKKLTFARVRDPNMNCELPVVLLASGFQRVD
jgi:hypothetical protein